MKALWRHLFFCERVLATIVNRLFESSEDFKQAFATRSRSGDEEMIDEFLK